VTLLERTEKYAANTAVLSTVCYLVAKAYEFEEVTQLVENGFFDTANP
jgi:hypothetical protein